MIVIDPYLLWAVIIQVHCLPTTLLCTLSCVSTRINPFRLEKNPTGKFSTFTEPPLPVGQSERFATPGRRQIIGLPFVLPPLSVTCLAG